jgi:hypothetical protein
MAQCWFCGKVKGKRACPARGGELICSRCCGSKRRVEIHCPPDCSYLHGAHDAKWISRSQERDQNRFLARLVSLEEPQAQFYLFLHHLLATTANPLSPLSDRELVDVVGTAEKTLETRARGVLYDHPTTSPHLQASVAWLLKIVASRKKIEAAPDVTEADALAAVAALAASISDHAKEVERDRYLEMIQRLLSVSFTERPALALPDELDEPPPTRLIVGP